MNRYGLYITVVVFFTLLAFFLYYHREKVIRHDTPLSFNTGRITGVTITSGESTVILNKGKDGWIVEPGFPARERAVDMLFQTLERLRYGSPASLSERDRLKEKLLNESVHISVNEGRRTKNFFLYSEGEGEPAYILARERDQPFRAEVTGFSGNPASLFVYDENYWMRNVLLNFTIPEIAQVKVIHADDTGSFLLKQSPENGFALYRYPENEPEMLNDSLAIRYLSGFFYIPFERFANARELMLLDSLAGSKPDFFLQVTGHNGEATGVSLHKIRNGSNHSFDLFRLHALINDNNDMIIIPWHSVDLLLRPRSYFHK